MGRPLEQLTRVPKTKKTIEGFQRFFLLSIIVYSDIGRVGGAQNRSSVRFQKGEQCLRL